MSEPTNNPQISDYDLNDDDDLQAWLAATLAHQRRLDEQDRRMGIVHDDEDEALPDADDEDEDDEDDEDGGVDLTDAGPSNQAAAAAASSDNGSSDSDLSVAPFYAPDSEAGFYALHRIKEAFLLDPTTPFETVRRFLETNESVIRHLATLTVAHPGSHVADLGGHVHEPRLERDSAVYAIELLYDINSLDWGSPRLEDTLVRIREQDRDNNTYFVEVLRKFKDGKRSVRARRWMLRHDPAFARLDRQLQAKKMRERQHGPRRSSLSKQVRFSDSEGSS